MSLFSIPYKDTLVPIAQVHGDQFFSDDGRVFTKRYDKFEILFDNKYIIFGGEAVKISMHPDGCWKDRWGTVYALRDGGAFVDPDPRCGIGIFSLPEGHPLNDVCRVHDYQFSSPYYQLFHTESEANKELYRNLKKAGASSFIAKLFYGLVDQLGGWWWENKQTKNR